MSVKIIRKSKEILDIKNATFTSIYYNIENYIDSANLQLSPNLENLISQLYAATGGVGLDIANYINNKNDVLIFADLIEKAIDNEQSGPHPFTNDVQKTLRNFHRSIINYADKLS